MLIFFYKLTKIVIQLVLLVHKDFLFRIHPDAKSDPDPAKPSKK